MSVKLRASSGTYNVRASELARDKPVVKTVRCVVYFLDHSEAAFEIDKRSKAQVLLDKVFEHLELVEKDYFGLQHVDTSPTSEGMQTTETLPVITSDVMRWLDPLKIIKKQMRVGPPYYLYFRVKFYVSDPSKLQEEYTRYHFFLQLKKDILQGKLVVPYKTSALLASYAVQSELGDFIPDEHHNDYLSEFRFVPNQTVEFEQDVQQLHQQHRGQTPADAEFNYLQQAKGLEMYGVDLHRARVRDQSNMEIQLGVTSVGLVVFQNSARINTFTWGKIVKISFKRKQFFIQLRRETNESVENLIGFNMVSYRSCKNLWKSCVEHHTFFRLHVPPAPKNSFLGLGSQFRYSGRTEFQTLEDNKRRARVERSFTRSPSKRYARRTVGASTRDAILEERNAIDGCRNTPHSMSMDSFRPDAGGGGVTSGGHSPLKTSASALPSSSSYPNSFRSTASPPRGTPTHYPHQPNNSAMTSPSSGGGGGDSFQHNNHIRRTLPSDYKQTNGQVGRAQNGNGSANSTLTRPAAGKNMAAGNNLHSGGAPPNSLMEPDRTPRALEVKATDYRLSRSVDARSEQRSGRLHESRSVDRATSRSLERRQGLDRLNGTSDVASGGGFSTTGSLRSNASTATTSHSQPHPHPHPAPHPTPQQPQQTSPQKKGDAFTPSGGKLIGYVDDDNSLPDQSYELPAYNELVPNGSAYQDGHGLVTIRIRPDAQGRFGFNVKGGADQSMPIIVSRVAPGTPADICIPRLNEGDQVLFINGRDVSQHTHEQVVMFIRASRETHSGELVLVVRPNAVYIGEDTPEEPDFQYIPDTHHISTTLPPGGDPLAGSLMLLQESLEGGAALAQFEQAYRKKPGMTMNAARLAENVPRNRYRDISPYDQTRVRLNTVGGDYINANFVNMEIKGSGVVNRYVAAQGPLPTTSADFWQAVWEQQSTLIVMLTTKVERGRVKCHQYWPDLYQTLVYGPLHVTCHKEDVTDSFAFRDFSLTNKQAGGEERAIRQMQYIAWPDHGVPDDSSDFLDFVLRVRQNRVGMVEPTVVHCSAGIGRTGVLITMETAMCLIEANQPVYPLDIVRQMRDQRAMLIQTSSQYKFVCEAILRVYNDKIVQPLEDYKR